MKWAELPAQEPNLLWAEIAFWLSQLAPVVAAIAAAVAAGIAAKAARDNRAFQREQLAHHEVADSELYYRELVANPILRALDRLRRETTDLIPGAVEDIRRLCDVNESQKAVRGRVDALIASFDDEWRELSDVVAMAIGTWPDQACNSALRKALEDLEDEVKQEMGLLAQNQEKPDVRRVLVRRVIAFDVAILTNAPSMKVSSGQALSPEVKLASKQLPGSSVSAPGKDHPQP